MSAIEHAACSLITIWLFTVIALPCVGLALDHVFDEEKAAHLVFKTTLVVMVAGPAAALLAGLVYFTLSLWGLC